MADRTQGRTWITVDDSLPQHRTTAAGIAAPLRAAPGARLRPAERGGLSRANPLVSARHRMTRSIAAATLGLAAAAFRPAPLAAQADAGAVLDRAVAAFGRVTTLRADFVQSLRDPMLGDATTRGELFQQRPDKFAMRWSQPRGDLLLADGSFLWVYLPSSTPGQVVKSAISGRPGSSPDVIAEFLERPRERFTVSYVRAEPVGGRAADVLAFVPRERGGPYSRVLLWIDRQDDLPHQVEITEASGATRRITLDRLRVNSAIPASTFTFRPPAGVRVVDASH